MPCLGLGKAAWAERMLGRDAADPVAGMLHEAALAVASGERDDVRKAAESLAAAMQVVGLDQWPRFVANAQARATANAQVIEVSYSVKKHSTTSAHNKPASSVNSHGLLAQQNVYNMGKMIESEAGGKGRDAKTAVAWALRNRMLRNNSSQVSNSWHGFAHSVSPTPESLQIARGVLDGSITDTTGGATHFYTPDRMPAKGEATIGRDVDGGLESVPEVKRKDKPVETYRPG